MKSKLILFLIMAMAVMSFAACGGDKESSDKSGSDTKKEDTNKTETIEITCLNGASEEIKLEVPYAPKRIVVIDMAALDILVSLGLEDSIVGSASTSLDYLKGVANAQGVANVGTIKTPDLEAIMECEPDIIFMGGRGAEYYDTLIEIAPVVRLVTDSEIGVVESVEKNAKIIASIFGMEDEIDKKVAGFGERITALQKIAKDKNAIVGMCTSGSFNVLGNDGRCSIIGVEIGFNNIGVDANIDTSTHGNEASFEYIVEKVPDYIFVMDRDAAIGAEGAKLAKEIVENDLVKDTAAYKNGNIIYLENPAVWYTAEGGIAALDIMLSDLEKGLSQE